MSDPLILLSVPGLRSRDLEFMPELAACMKPGEQVPLRHNFPAMTWPSQANMLTGTLANEHGVVANGFYWRDTQQVEMWTAWNEKIERPQIWDVLKSQDPPQTSAAWFPMLSKGCGADYVCMPAPVHNPDGSESMWCYTKPQEFYGELLESLDHFPLKHFWGPLAGIPSSRWIADSAVIAAKKFRPDFFYLYFPHLDYAAQKFGPDSEQALDSLRELDAVFGDLQRGMQKSYGKSADLTWMVASEYVITPVDHVSYPNRVLRDAGLLAVDEQGGLEQLDFAASRAWALVDHQLGHVFVRDETDVTAVQELFAAVDGIAEALAGDDRSKYGLDHERSGEVVLVSEPNSWQAYYWWHDDTKAPVYARTVDIHQKPGYDPVELFFDPVSKCIPLDATLVRGSHGVPVNDAEQQGLLVCSRPGFVGADSLQDVDVYDVVLKVLGVG